MMKISKACFIILLMFFISINLVTAYIESEIKIYNISENNERRIIEPGELEIIYYLSNGKTYIIGENEERFIFKPEDLFCWSNCNIYPDFKIYKEEIVENGEIISIHDTDIVNGEVKNLKNLFEIYKSRKITLENKEEIIVSDSNRDSLSEEGDFYVRWNGELIINEEEDYHFFIDVSRGAIITLNGTVVLSSINQDEEKTFNLTLAPGNYSINISYWSNEDYGAPNLFWERESFINEPVPKSNLHYINGTITRFSSELKAQRSFSVSSFPESYNIDYNVYPSGVVYIPKNIENSKPLILVHGLHGEYPYWYNIPKQLTEFDNDVWEFYYQEANVSNFMTSGLLKFALDKILSYYPVNTKANIVAHSMGTLVTLGYIENLGKYPNENQVSYQNNIDGVVLIAGPIHGSHLANKVMKGESAGLVCGLFVDPDDPKAQAYYDIAVGSEFTWLLNKNGLNKNIRYISIAGTDDDILCMPFESDDSDSFVSVSSASLLNYNIPLVLIKANHDNLRGHCRVGGGRCRGIWPFVYYDDKMSDLIDKFLEGASQTTLKSKLYNGEYYIANTSDLANVPFTEGVALMKFTDYELLNILNVKLRKDNIDYLFTKNYQTNIFYHYNYGEGPFLSCIANKFGNLSLTINDMICIVKIGIAINSGVVDESLLSCLNTNLAKFGIKLITQDIKQCLSTPVDYGLTMPKGKYDLYINGKDIGYDIEIKPLQTIIYEIIPSVRILSPLNNSAVNTSDVIVRFNVSDWSVGGKEQKHIHFHLEGLEEEGLRFTDHLMFYNGNNRIVELNLGNGGTKFATWLGEGRLRLNDLPIGRYRLRAHLASQDHSVVGNPEADTEITFNVSLCKVLSPVNNAGYNNRRVPFLIKSSEVLDEIEYIDFNDRIPRWRNLCRGCDQFNKSLSFRDGNHKTFIKCTDLQEKAEEYPVNFFIDTKKPDISKTLPKRNSFTNGSGFSVEYDEDNLKYVRLLWNPDKTRIDCPSGRNQECKFTLNLTKWNGQEILYWFELEDIAGNKDSSNKIKVFVDTNSPVINSFNYLIEGRRARFIVRVVEDNFEAIEYIDYNERNPRWRILCNRLKNNICDGSRGFSKGAHKVEVRARDKAGNSASKMADVLIN